MRLGFVDAVVLGRRHVGQALRPAVGHPVLRQRRREGFYGDLLEADRPSQHFGHDLRHAAWGQIIGAGHRDALLSAPGVIQQQTGSDRGEITGGDRRKRAVTSAWQEDRPLAPDRLFLLEQVLHEERHGRRPVAHARALDQPVYGQRRRQEPASFAYP